MTTLGLYPDRKRVYQLMRIYEAASAKIYGLVFGIDAGNYSDAMANKIKREVTLEVHRLNLKAMMWSKVAIPEAYNQSKNFNKEIFEKVNMKPDPDYRKSIHQMTIDKAISTTENILIKANMSIIPQVKVYLSLIKNASKIIVRADIQELSVENKEVVNEIVTEGIDAEITLRKISGDVEAYLRFELKAGNFIRINGKNYNMKLYSKMVARTQMRITQSVATKNISKQFENDLVAWSDHFQRYRDEACAPYAGNTYSLSGDSKKFRKLPATPPTHPNCEHYLNVVPQPLVDMEPERFPETIKQKVKVLEIAS